MVEGEQPTAAGLYDAYLGGSDHTAAEREAADQLRVVVPDVATIAWANRGFHQRAVRWLAEQGVRQFVDLGSGLPTQNNTHQVAQRVEPDARVVYVDQDPRTAERGRQLVADDPRTGYLNADMRRPDEVLTHPGLAELIDFAEPVGLVTSAVLHFVSPEADPWGIIRRYVDAFVPGSYLALSHGTAEKVPYRPVQAIYQLYRNADEMVYFRNRDEVEWFFDGLELVPPYDGADTKVTFAGLWGCEDPVAADDDSGRWLYVGVARRPG